MLIVSGGNYDVSSNIKSWLLVSTVVAALCAGATAAQAGGGGGSGEERTACPVAHGALVQQLRAAVAAVGSLHMWGAVVNRDGVVCAIGFSGADRNAQFPVSRVISAAKAFTANGLSLDGSPLSTAQVYGATQPRASLFGLADGNPVDAAAAYRGPTTRFGTASDPLVGKRIGGTITFGGGVSLFTGGTTVVGGIGVSGDTACADDDVVRELRKRLGLVPSASDTASFGPGAGQHPTC